MTDHVQLFLDGAWSDGHGGGVPPFWNPATGEEIGTVAVAEPADLEHASSPMRPDGPRR